MKINQAGLDLVKTYEGFRSDIYICSGNRKSYGFGSTRGFDGKRLTGNEKPISREDAEKLLKRDLQSAEKAIHRMVKVPLSENQFSAICSWIYNLGSGSWQRSTARLKLNRFDYTGCINEMIRWNRASGKRLRGLVLRRESERLLFLRS